MVVFSVIFHLHLPDGNPLCSYCEGSCFALLQKGGNNGDENGDNGGDNDDDDDNGDNGDNSDNGDNGGDKADDDTRPKLGPLFLVISV